MTFLLMRRICDHPYYAFPWEDWANRNGGIINDYTDNEWIQAITWLYSTSAFFAYCGNNPVKRFDPAGNSFISDFTDWIGDGLDYLIGQTQNVTSKINICLSQGYAGNASPMIVDDLQAACLSFDTRGNIALQYQPLTLGFTTSDSPSASFVVTTAVSFVESVEILNGEGTSAGISVFTPFYGLGGGIDYNIIGSHNDEKTYKGFTASAGVGVPSPEVHVLSGKTYTAFRINVYSIAHGCVRKFKEWGRRYE